MAIVTSLMLHTRAMVSVPSTVQTATTGTNPCITCPYCFNPDVDKNKQIDMGDILTLLTTSDKTTH
jgi:hypothetical protein